MRRIASIAVGLLVVGACSSSTSTSTSTNTSRSTGSTGSTGATDAPGTAGAVTSGAPGSTWASTPPGSPASAICSGPEVTVEAVPDATDDLLLVDDHGDVLRLDLATGTVTCDRPNDADEPAPWVWGMPAGAIRLASGLLISTVSYGGGSWYVPDDPSEAVVPLYERFAVGTYWPAGAVDTVWLFEADRGAVSSLDPVGLLTEPVIQLPGDERPVAADGHGGLVILAGSGYWMLAADGSSTSLWNGSYLAAVGADTIVGLACEATDSCRLIVVDRASGDERDLGVGPGAFARADLPEFVALSPAGTMLATPTLDGDLSSVTPLDGPMVIDLSTGSVVELAGGVWPGSTRDLVWSDGGSSLYWIDGGGGLRAWSAGDPGTGERLGAEILPVLRDVAVDGE